MIHWLTAFQHRVRIISAMAAALLLLPANLALATNYRLPNFHKDTIEESWKTLKEDFKFPPLPEGKTWSDGYKILPIDKNLRYYQILRKNDKPQKILMATVVKMVSVLEYSDPCNLSYTAPVWMRTEEARKKSFRDAQAVLKEVGPQCLPYIWEALKDDLAYDANPNREAIETYNAAQQGVVVAWENLRQELRSKSPDFKRQEDELFRLGIEFELLTDQGDAEASRVEAKYMILFGEMTTLQRKITNEDSALKKLSDAHESAKENVTKLLGKVPGNYITDHQGNLHVSGEFRTHLREVLSQFGESSKNFLKVQTRDRDPILRKEAETLLDQVDKLQKAEQEKKAGK